MTVWVYVDTRKQVGDKDHLKVFASEDAPRHGSSKTTRKALRSSMRFWSEPHRPANNLCDASDCRHRHLEVTESERMSHVSSGVQVSRVAALAIKCGSRWTSPGGFLCAQRKRPQPRGICWGRLGNV